MIRPVWLRTLTALWGIWFATALTEPAGLLACPMHSGQAAMAPAAVADEDAAPATLDVAAGDEHAAHGSASASLGHAAGASQTRGGATRTPDPSGHHSCTCLGQCCTMAIDALAERADVLLPAPASRVIRTRLPAVVAFVATPVEHSRPFANGPPALIG